MRKDTSRQQAAGREAAHQQVHGYGHSLKLKNLVDDRTHEPWKIGALRPGNTARNTRPSWFLLQP